MRFKVAAGLVAAMFVPALFFSVVLFVGYPVSAQSNQPQTKPSGPASPKLAKTYLHPVRKFVLAIPLGAELSERGEAVQVSIRSRQGYIINIQTGDVNPALTLAEMVSKLEAQYLGLGKPWSQKIGGKSTTVAGLQAAEAMYEGANTRVKVIIVRGAKTDFVFIFFAPIDTFEKLANELNWFLSNFQPNPADLVLATKSGTKSKTKSGEMAEKSSATGGVTPKRFSQSGFGYSIQYPGNWEVTKPSDNIATFSGKKGTAAFQAVVNIQNVKPAKAKNPGDAADQVLADLKASLARDAVDFSIVGEKPLTYKNGNLSLAGRQMVVVYTYAGQRYRKWALVLPRPAGTIAHIWSYTAPENQFKEYRPIADAMLKSWTIQPGSG